MPKYFDAIVDEATRRVARAICARGGEVEGRDPDEVGRYWTSGEEGPRWWLWVPAAQDAIVELDGVRAEHTGAEMGPGSKPN